jgi:glycosyltransferase involved in cell wall biosynthesis
MEYRIYYLSREWVRAGHKVVVVSADWSHLRTHNPAVARDWSVENLDGIDYVWVRAGRYKGNGLARARSMMTFVLKCWARASYMANTWAPDVVVTASTYVMDTWPGQRIARIAGAVYIHEVRDLWPLTLCTIGGRSSSHPFVRLLQIAENSAYRNADTVVTTLSDAFEYMKDHGLARDRFCYAPNGVSLDDRDTTLPIPEHIARCVEDFHSRGFFVVGYAGRLGVANSIGTLLSAADLLHDFPVAFVLIGEGVDRPSPENGRAGGRVVFFGAIPKVHIPEVLRVMDTLWLGWNRSPVYRYGISANKLYDYAIAARPILHSYDFANDLVSASGCGLRVPAEDPHALAEAVLRLMRLPAKVRRQMGAKGREYVATQHDYRAIASQMVELFQSLATRHGSGRKGACGD